MTTLPTNIVAGDPDHIVHHNRIHGYAGFVDNANSWAQDQRFASGRPWVDVTAAPYGADPTGALDSTAAVNAALSAAVALQQTSGIPGAGSVPEVYFPKGIYKLTGSITSGGGINYINFIGDNAIFIVSAGVTAFDVVRYMVRFKGITILGGGVGVSINTGNVDTDLISFDECEFHDQTTAAIRTVSPSSSTLLSIRSSKFYNATTNNRCLNLSGVDLVVMEDCWVSWGIGTDPVIDLTNVQLHLIRMYGVPLAGSGPWINASGTGGVLARYCRFGGESGGKRIVDSSLTLDSTYPVIPTYVEIYDSECYVPANQQLITVNSLPNVIRTRGIRGNTDGRGVRFNALSVSDKNNFGSCVIDVENDTSRVTDTLVDEASDQFGKDQAINLNQRPPKAGYLQVADVKVNVEGASASLGGAVVVSNVAGNTPGDVFGRTIQRGTCSANPGQMTKSFATALAGFTTGVYTLVVRVEVESGANAQAQVFAGGISRYFDLNEGRHMLHVPFRYDSTIGQSTQVGCTVGRLETGDVVSLCDFRVFKGNVRIDEPITIVYDTAIPPVAGSWLRTDECIQAIPSGGGKMGQVCVLAGSPGTWKAFGAIDA